MRIRDCRNSSTFGVLCQITCADGYSVKFPADVVSVPFRGFMLDNILFLRFLLTGVSMFPSPFGVLC